MINPHRLCSIILRYKLQLDGREHAVCLVKTMRRESLQLCVFALLNGFSYEVILLITIEGNIRVIYLKERTYIKTNYDSVGFSGLYHPYEMIYLMGVDKTKIRGTCASPYSMIEFLGALKM